MEQPWRGQIPPPDPAEDVQPLGAAQHISWAGQNLLFPSASDRAASWRPNFSLSCFSTSQHKKKRQFPKPQGAGRAAGPCRGSVVLSHPHPSTLGILGFLCLAELFPAAASPWHLGQDFSPPCVTPGEAEPPHKGWEWSKLSLKVAQQTQEMNELQATAAALELPLK